MKQNHLSKTRIERLPLYLQYLKNLPPEKTSISATVIARNLHFGEVQVRKDLGSVVGGGKPKIGYETNVLIETLEAVLGYGVSHKAVIVGAGKLGMALLDYGGLWENGCQVLAAFDSDPEKIGSHPGDKPILSMEEFDSFLSREPIEIGIITVPENVAQEICDRLVSHGVKAIWNFAPVRLHQTGDVFIKQENMAASLAALLGHLNHIRT